MMSTATNSSTPPWLREDVDVVQPLNNSSSGNRPAESNGQNSSERKSKVVYWILKLITMFLCALIVATAIIGIGTNWITNFVVWSVWAHIALLCQSISMELRLLARSLSRFTWSSSLRYCSPSSWWRSNQRNGLTTFCAETSGSCTEPWESPSTSYCKSSSFLYYHIASFEIPTPS